MLSIVILGIKRSSLSKPKERVDRLKRRHGSTLETTLRNSTGRWLERYFKEQFKQGRSHQTIQRICETRSTTPPLGLLTGDSIGERSMGDIGNWSPEFISI